MKLLVLSAADLDRVLPMPVVIEAMKQAYAELSGGEAIVPQRLALPVAAVDGTTLIKPALTRDGLGTKLVSVFPRNRERGLDVTTGLVVVLDPESGTPVGICDGTHLTALRTGAAVGAATDLLARDNVKQAALFGCGGQARSLALAMDAVRGLETLRVFARTGAAVRRFVAAVEPQLRARLIAAESAGAALEGAELICTATTSSTPVFDGSLLSPGTHVNGVGSFTAEMQELDVTTVERSRVFVDSRSAALAEAGDLLIAQQAGVTCERDWTEIGEVVAGSRSGRERAEEITLFKSVGVAVQDVKAAVVALERARSRGVGREIEL